DTTKPATTHFQTQHRDHADALAKRAGAAPAKGANATLALVLASRLTSATDERSALTVALGVENQLTETYVAAFGTVTSPDVVRLLATIVPVAASRAAALASLLGAATSAALPNGALEGTTLAGTDNTDIKLGFDPAAFAAG